MKLRILAVLTVAGLTLLLFALRQRGASASDQPAARRVPVIVELFTSEGCSSCPPADALLRRLEEQQPVAGAEIIVLGHHVDYWNYIGWTDRFSAKAFSDRQREYGDAFGLDGVYTPQMVVDGRTELNGADESRAKRAIAEAAKQPRVPVEVSVAGSAPGTVTLRIVVAASAGMKKSDLMLAVTEARLETQVKKGENDGRTLMHTGVVRWLGKVGEVNGAGTEAGPVVKIDPAWKRADLRAVVFVQEKSSRHILGAAAVKLGG